jgi:hypothetical protein
MRRAVSIERSGKVSVMRKLRSRVCSQVRQVFRESISGEESSKYKGSEVG